MIADTLSRDVALTVDVHSDDIGHVSTLRLRGALEVRHAASARQSVIDFVDASDPASRLVVDLTTVEELDAAGLAAVTSPVLSACRGGRAVAVIPPVAARPRRLVDQVGIFPIGTS